ncbi:MAG: cobalamin-dependent protein [Desulfarculaceae bacterium]|nr:cobalamin-dependent protein [Desulfarculaceae bacterium]
MQPQNDHGVLLALLADLREKEVSREVDNLLGQGVSPYHILETCQAGMREVGRHYSNGEYFISGLIMAGEIMRRVALMIAPAFKKELGSKKLGVVLLGTVKGDIHDIGKNLFKVLLECYGFSVLDLGVDVQPKDFLNAVKKCEPDIIGISSLLTSSYDNLRETITMLSEAMAEQGLKVPVVIGGGMSDKKVSDFVGADYWAPDAVQGVRLCKEIVGAAG